MTLKKHQLYLSDSNIKVKQLKGLLSIKTDIDFCKDLLKVKEKLRLEYKQKKQNNHFDDSKIPLACVTYTFIMTYMKLFTKSNRGLKVEAKTVYKDNNNFQIIHKLFDDMRDKFIAHGDESEGEIMHIVSIFTYDPDTVEWSYEFDPTNRRFFSLTENEIPLYIEMIEMIDAFWLKKYNKLSKSLAKELIPEHLQHLTEELSHDKIELILSQMQSEKFIQKNDYKDNLLSTK